MQRIAGAKPKHVLVGEFRRCPEVSACDWQNGEALGNQLVEQGERRRAVFEVICPVRSLIAKAEDISVMVQSLIRSWAGSCSASQL